MLLDQVPDLHAAVADCVSVRIDSQQVDLPNPRRARVTSHVGQFRGPFRVFLRVIVLAAVRVVDWIACTLFALVDPMAPTIDTFW